MLKKIVVFILVGVVALNAVTIEGKGYSNKREEAIKNALADLSQKIAVSVESNYESVTKVLNGDYKQVREKLIRTKSDLPILSPEYRYSGVTKSMIATLESKKVLHLYITKLKDLKKVIKKDLSNIKTKTENQKYSMYKEILKNIELFNKYKTVAIILEAKDLPTIKTTEAEIKTNLIKLERRVKTLKLAGLVLSKNTPNKKVYIYPSKTGISNDITQFSRVLKNEIASNLITTKRENEADYFYRGEYEILKKSIFVSYTLLDKNNKSINSNTVLIDQKAYKNLNYKVKTMSFDESLNKTFVKSGKLSVTIGIKGYYRNDGIDLSSGDEIDIILKANKEACYYIVGHVLRENNPFSYLLPLKPDSMGKEMFIDRVTGSDVNRNITILEQVPVEPPFGSEAVQLFASTMKNGNCPLTPPKCSENSDGYCVIGGTPDKVVIGTRGLNMKKRKRKVENAEAVLRFTSFGE